jgi:hypothetical protein
MEEDRFQSHLQHGSRSGLGVAATVNIIAVYGLYNGLEGARSLTMVLLGVARNSCIAPQSSAAEGVGSPATMTAVR